MAIGGYFINGYLWIFYCWLLLVIILMVIGGYFIDGYWWLFYWWLFYCRPLMVILLLVTFLLF